ncbi:unnamed protein product [Rangifer tarandus platyrhynchus]|uniref:Uncharacterized protein n=1 Tax=Rangifer tarandus platyrhynchus TaxID=3082113 RepID=A0ABN8XWM8_RANTA|nr:unnamed protein product [Rangifer tarandus platyrhynchus]
MPSLLDHNAQVSLSHRVCHADALNLALQTRVPCVKQLQPQPGWRAVCRSTTKEASIQDGGGTPYAQTLRLHPPQQPGAQVACLHQTHKNSTPSLADEVK